MSIRIDAILTLYARLEYPYCTSSSLKYGRPSQSKPVKKISYSPFRRTHHIAQCAMHWPDFWAKTNYRKPVHDRNSCFIDAFPQKKSFCKSCGTNPVHQQSFSSFMELCGKGKRPWPWFHDTELLLEGAKLGDGSAFIADVDGHHTIDLLRVLEKHPNLPEGSLVLEDLPEIVASVKVTTQDQNCWTRSLCTKYRAASAR